MSKAFPFTAGRLCLCFLATLGNRGSEPFERLESPNDLSRWLVEARLVDSPPAVMESDLQDVRTLREVIYRVALARMQHRTPEPEDRERLNAWAARPPLTPQLNGDGCTCTWEGQYLLDAAQATIARDAVMLFASPEAERLKVCAQPSCAMLFLDTSRAGQRRWCSMNVCGNRAKKEKYYKGRGLSDEPDENAIKSMDQV